MWIYLPKFQKPLFVFCLCGVVVIFCIFGQPYYDTSQNLFRIKVRKTVEVSGNATAQQLSDEKPNKVIFIGNEWSGYIFDGKKLQKNLEDEKCPVTCSFAMDYDDLKLADAIVFQTYLNFEHAFIWPHLTNQLFIYRDIESPIYSSASRRTLKDEAFNWTMTYHISSDIITYYGHLQPIEISERPYNAHLITSNMTTYSLYMEAMEKYDNATEVPSYIGRDNKTNIVAWMSSHCPTSSRRETYVKQLSKYMKVHTYGKCGKEKCGKRLVYGGPCWETNIGPNFYFYLSMENSLCEGYITEKLFNPLIHGVVPVVYGASNYSKILPPNSFIDARDFHPKELAAYLQKIVDDPLEYKRFHLWRKFWTVIPGQSYCDLCIRLHQDYSPKFYTDIRKFRMSRETCLTPNSWKGALKNKPSALKYDHS